MTRTPPLTSTVLYVGAKRHPYQVAPIYRLSVLYATPTTVACVPIRQDAVPDGELCAAPGKTVVSRKQTHVYPIADDAAWRGVVRTQVALQTALTDLANGLRALGSYARQLAAAGGVAHAPNPLCPTVIRAEDPDGGAAYPAWQIIDAVPEIRRQAIVRHTPMMLAVPNDVYTFRQANCFVCPDDAAWERIAELDMRARQAAKAWWSLLDTDLMRYDERRAALALAGAAA